MKVKLVVFLSAALAGFIPSENCVAADLEPAPVAAPRVSAERPTAPRRASTSSRLSTVIRRENGGSGVVVIHSTKPTLAKHSEMQEDMQIMAHLLAKILDQSGLDDAREAMGIALSFSAAKTTRHLFIEGVGAVFTYNVDFPLAPATRESTGIATNAVTSDWEKAQQTLYGRPEGEKVTEHAPRKYDHKAIERLEDTLVRALKNAHHMRHLKREDKITLVISYSPLGFDVLSSRIGELLLRAEGAASNKAYRGQLSQGSTLQISARKGDIDALAGNRMTFEEFRGKVVSFAY